MDDKRILQLLFDRAEAVFDALARRFGRRLTLTAMNVLGSAEDAEECVSDTYLAIWNAIPPAKPDPLTPYVYRTGKNIALNRLRARNAQKRSSYELSLEELSGCIAAPAQDRELGRMLNDWLCTLPKKDRVIFLRRHWYGDSVKDISKAVAMTEGAVSVRLHRLKVQLKDYLTKEGYYE
ncbi:MAG: sigma-70 family RNA polymerase sigma factor [Oscillospiraceae bacterium]|nr:sigma-70 family RNA polymerase sigma factor [Oscillospiraceae bacterium]